jgi:broad specificity phosphatase PhoE
MEEKMELILIRHGESEGNVKGLVYGHTDYPLTEKGMQQAHKIAEIIKRYKINKVYTSPLVRAKAIAEAISQECNVSLSLDDRLKEIHFGEYEDMRREQVIEKVGDKYYDVIGFFDHVALPGGEHQDDFLSRVNSFVDELLAGEDGIYAITSHFGAIKAILHHLMGYDKQRLRQFAIKPGAIIKLTIKKDRVRMDELIQTIDLI